MNAKNSEKLELLDAAYFRKREVELVLLLLREETRRPSSALVKNPEFSSVYKKFLSMQTK